MQQLIDGLKSVKVRTGLHLIHNVDSNDFAAIIVIVGSGGAGARAEVWIHLVQVHRCKCHKFE